MLAAASRDPNEQIAREVGVCADTVRKWRGRYARQGLAGLKDLPRSGRPTTFSPAEIAQVKAIACTNPRENKQLPLARWSVTEIAAQTIREGIVTCVCRTTVERWLDQDAIKPWQTRSWISPRDPLFAVKGGMVLDLYQRQWYDALAEHILTFQNWYNTTAQPFNWTWTRTQLNNYLNQLDNPTLAA